MSGNNRTWSTSEPTDRKSFRRHRTVESSIAARHIDELSKTAVAKANATKATETGVPAEALMSADHATSPNSGQAASRERCVACDPRSQEFNFFSFDAQQHLNEECESSQT